MSGESGADLEEEVLLVAVAVGHALDDLDAVVHALDEAGVQAIAGMADDAVQIGPEPFGKAL